MSQVLVDCREVSKSFGSVQALRDVNFQIMEGESVALVGPNGAGKTTLMGLMCGFLSPSAGELRVLGAVPGQSGTLGVVGALPQDTQFNANDGLGAQLSFLGELEGMTRSVARETARRVLDVVQLSDRWDARFDDLSNGMRKRALLAQAFLKVPRVLIVDEPTAGLDPENARSVRRLLADLKSKTTLVVSSHDLAELENLCSRTLFLEQGRLEAVGHDSPEQARYLTVVFETSDVASAIEVIEALPEVVSVEKNGAAGLLIEVDLAMHPDVDISVILALKGVGISYRSILRGRTLEDQLFHQARESE